MNKGRCEKPETVHSYYVFLLDCCQLSRNTSSVQGLNEDSLIQYYTDQD